MSVLPRLLLSLLFLVLSCSREHLRGQEQVCEKCNGTGYLEAEPCPTHKALRLPIAERGMQLMWGSTETCCNLTGTKPCLACATKKRTAENEEDRRLDHHYYYAWRSGNAVSVDSLGNVLRKMGTGYLVGCTDRFLVVANPPVGQFTKAEYAALEPELKDASEKFPGLVKLQTNTVTPEDMTLLYLLRCEDLYQKFWKLLAREDAPDFMLYHKGHEGELYVTPTRRRIEAFVLHTPESLSAFEVQHYGNSRMIGIPERFTVTRPETSESFQEDPLPGDRHSSSMLAYRIGSALATRLVTFQNERKDRSITVPFFLEIGLAHALAIDATGKSVYKAGTSEVRATGGNQDEVDEWKSEGWLALMSKLVGTRKDGSSNAPTFDQLTSVKLETANFSHHVSAWSLVTFLRLLPDDGQKKFLQFILQIRSGVDPSGALNAVYGVTGRELTEAWHAWARDSSKQLLAPSSPLIGLGPENVLANYKKVMAEKEGRNKNAADLAQRRLGAIRSLRWGPATEAANELILLLSEKNKSKSKDDKSRRSEDEALAALQTLRAAELARPEVASILNEKLKTSVNKTGDETFQIRLLRSAGTQIGERGLLLPVLQRYLQSPALVASSATHTLGELKDPKSLPALREVAASQSALLRAEAAKAIAEIGPENDLELATKLLGDNSWHVRIAAIEMFKKLRTSEAGDKLIARMPLENGRLLEDIENTLIEMTRPQLLPTSAEDWREFWYNRGGRDSIASGTAPKSTNSRTQSGADFAGFPPIKSKRFMFMVDVSESMNQPVNIIPKGGTSASSNSRPKIRFITEKLRDLITDPKQIPADVLFDIAFFASNTDLWKGLLVPTEGEGSANRNSAAQFLTFEGRAQVASTDLKRALESAIKLAEESLNKGDRESAIDTIYLLTDGSPTAGKIQDPDQLCEWFREANRNHRIKVFVICIGATDTDMSFLERLSRENYGPKPVVVMKDG